MDSKFCAQCGAGLPEAGANFCPKCGKPVAAKPAPSSADPGGPSALNVEIQMRDLLRAGKLIDAVVAYRKATQGSLKEAKDKVRELIRKYSIPPPTLPPLGTRLRNRFIVSTVLGAILAAVGLKLLPHPAQATARLACERLLGQTACPAGAMTWQPFAVFFAVGLAGVFLLISVWRAFTSDIPPLWRNGPENA